MKHPLYFLGLNSNPEKTLTKGQVIKCLFLLNEGTKLVVNSASRQTDKGRDYLLVKASLWANKLLPSPTNKEPHQQANPGACYQFAFNMDAGKCVELYSLVTPAGAQWENIDEVSRNPMLEMSTSNEGLAAVRSLENLAVVHLPFVDDDVKVSPVYRVHCGDGLSRTHLMARYTRLGRSPSGLEFPECLKNGFEFFFENQANEAAKKLKTYLDDFKLSKSDVEKKKSEEFKSKMEDDSPPWSLSDASLLKFKGMVEDHEKAKENLKDDKKIIQFPQSTEKPKIMSKKMAVVIKPFKK